MRRVVITGAGTINALGEGVAATKTAMAEGRSGIGPLSFADVERLSIRIGGQIHGFDATSRFTSAQLAQYDPFTQYALVAGAEAMAQAGLERAPDPASWGCIIGTAGGGHTTANNAYRAVFADQKNRVHPLTVPKLMGNSAPSHLSIRYGLQGPSFAVATACASSNHAIGLAFQMVRSGMAEGMLAGGSEAMLNFGGLKAWEGLRVMSPDGCRPFSADRNGMVQGEGAGVFVIETLESAEARGARPLAEIAGFAMNSDARDVVMPSREGASAAISGALRDAAMAPEEVGYINAHGTGTAANDRIETAAIRAALGPTADQVAVSSTKALHGHCIGGTGAVELIACLMALGDGVIAPTANYTTPDPDCDLDYVPNTARKAQVGAALSNAFAFGGLNAVLALRAI
ncbi:MULTISPECIES: beta-ketoacyl-[acyl-carrier-protein] synthase family protein [Thioclava]|uniref:beta-ketoacyl-[acyl-carrier-protein] synthase family protein n=1 Tax=Thioclava TaxID=285107 RepID=UPI000B53BBD1|nr:MULTISPECIES: beta-ketoacyl-[acyl-carrier-protein] synthase family protein [Thioclava]OWY06992.1 beta-ACP synthase [Thioclava sp. IC9]WGT50558.1 beta-ketoacyl-[acyl-carrier-protein] synthase family protein [Thioclava nitratireducens]